MGLLDSLKRKFNNSEKQEKRDSTLLESMGVNYGEVTSQSEEPQTPYVPPELPEGEIVSIAEDGFLDATSRDAEERLKHNLEILIDRTKKAGKVEKFMLIRDDDFFPTGWEWKVLSKNTNMEKTNTNLSYEIKKAQSRRLRGEPTEAWIGDIRIPISASDTDLSNVDREFAYLNLPSKFRSTKHFTVNTPLGVTGNYNGVSANRNFTIIDNMSNFLNSGYAYSVAYHDAYLDVTHESLPISPEAVVLINNEKYDQIMSDEKTAQELAQRRVIRYKGKEDIAIDMILTEMGVIPSQIGTRFAYYDNELCSIIDDSMQNLAKDNDLLFDQSHGGDLLKGTGHFTSNYDDKNNDFNDAMEEFWQYLENKFPNYPNIRYDYPSNVVDKVGLDELISAIDEFNGMAETQFEERSAAYDQDRASITPEIHDKFVKTVKGINEFYKTDNTFWMPKVEEQMRRFFYADTVAEQLEVAEHVQAFLQSRDIDKQEGEAVHEPIDSKQIFTNALRNTTPYTANNARQMEVNEINQERGTQETPEIK